MCSELDATIRLTTHRTANETQLHITTSDKYPPCQGDTYLTTARKREISRHLARSTGGVSLLQWTDGPGARTGLV
jgi:hypothetical protein